MPLVFLHGTLVCFFVVGVCVFPWWAHVNFTCDHLFFFRRPTCKKHKLLLLEPSVFSHVVMCFFHTWSCAFYTRGHVLSHTWSCALHTCACRLWTAANGQFAVMDSTAAAAHHHNTHNCLLHRHNNTCLFHMSDDGNKHHKPPSTTALFPCGVKWFAFTRHPGRGAMGP